MACIFPLSPDRFSCKRAVSVPSARVTGKLSEGRQIKYSDTGRREIIKILGVV
jgi:hypothetical protein